MSDFEPRIYVACLAAYNSGYLHGAWIDADQDEDDLLKEAQAILDSSPIPNAEEWAIHDSEGFGDLRLSEYTSMETVAQLAKFVLEHGDVGVGLLEYNGMNIEEAERMLEECYYGEHESEADFVSDFMEETQPVPEHLQFYIDYERMARDWFVNDFLSINAGGKVHVFSHC